MATYYFDSVNGSDSNSGLSPNLAKATYEAWSQGSTAAGDKFLFKRGTTQTISTVGKSLIGGSSGNVVYYGAYGDADQPRPRFIFPVSPSTGIFNQSRRSYYTIEDWHFDMQGSEINSLYIAAMSLGTVRDVTIRRCLFENAGGDYPGLYIGRENSTNTTDGVTVEDCVFRYNGADGITILAANNVTVRNCVGYDNGADGPNGGHNFRITSRKVTVTSGWTNSSGNIYFRALAAYETDVYFVQTPTYARMTKTTGTSPTAGQFSVSGGNLYINNNGNPSGVSITYVLDPCDNVQIIGCTSYRSLWNQAAPFQEGHGFSFDDWASNSSIVGCYSYDNEGLGISINGGDDNLIQGCVIYNNPMRGISLGSGQRNLVYNNVLHKNNVGTGASTAEIGGAATSNDCEVKNNIIVGTVATGVDFSTATGCVADKNCFVGVTTNVNGGTSTNELTIDPRFDPRWRPTNARLFNGGANVGGNDLYGNAFPASPSIGAIQCVGAYPRANLTTYQVNGNKISIAGRGRR